MAIQFSRSLHGCILAASLALALAACDDPLGPGRALVGTWAAPLAVPGSSFTFTLSAFGDSLWGTGAYAGEAGPYGILTVTGHVQAAPLDTVTLTFTLNQEAPSIATSSERFVGLLRDSTTLIGSLSTLVGGNIVTVAATYLRTH